MIAASNTDDRSFFHFRRVDQGGSDDPTCPGIAEDNREYKGECGLDVIHPLPSPANGGFSCGGTDMTSNGAQAENLLYRLQLGIGGAGKWPLSVLILEKAFAASSLGEAVLMARESVRDQLGPVACSRACLIDHKNRIRWETRLEGLRRHWKNTNHLALVPSEADVTQPKRRSVTRDHSSRSS